MPPDDLARERRALADRQAALVHAALGDGERPAGVDEQELERLREVLRAKVRWVARRRARTRKADPSTDERPRGWRAWLSRWIR